MDVISPMETVTSIVGQRVLRKEDAEILSGQAKFTEDLVAPNALWMAAIRSPYARAKILSINSTIAISMPGVVGVYTGQSIRNELVSPLPCAWPVTDDIKIPDHWPVAIDTVNYVGDAVAVVIAETREQALDAIETVRVSYEPLPPVVTIEDALSDTEIIYREFETNTSYRWELRPNEDAVDTAFETASYTVNETYVQQRLIPAPIEPRKVCAIPTDEGYTLYSSTQVPHLLKDHLSTMTGIESLRVIAPHVGGGFGGKLQVIAEEAICLVLEIKLGRPVRWGEYRTECSQTMHHGRGQIQNIELAADENGKITAVRANLTADMGAYLQILTPGIPLLGAFLYAGCYDVPAYSFSCTGVFTNKVPTDAYRGAGRPEATYAIERAIDALARKVGIDSTEIRRRNFIPPFVVPHLISSGLSIDSGNYVAALDKALELVHYDSLRAVQEDRRKSGSKKHLGIGFSTYVENCGWAPSWGLEALRYSGWGGEEATVRVLENGKVEVVVGTSPHGQGHETAFSQIVVDKLGVKYEDVTIIHSDTLAAPFGWDTYGSRSLSVGGTAVGMACDKLLISGGTSAVASFDPPNFVFPSGTHICVLEIDEDTGGVTLLQYVAVDDVGTRVNPQIVEGQIHGGIVQGISQALFEEARYDENGTLLSSTFADYTIPYASEMISFTLGSVETPSSTNPLGTKGVGETGAIASTPAVINAVVDALSHLGVTDIQMPASPHRIWQTIQSSKGKLNNESSQ